MSRSPYIKIVSNSNNLHKGNGHSNQSQITNFFKVHEGTAKTNSHFYRNGQTIRQELHTNAHVASNHRSPSSSPARSPSTKIPAKNGNFVHSNFQNGRPSPSSKANVNRSNEVNFRNSASIPISSARILDEHLKTERAIIQGSKTYSQSML